MVNPEIDMEPEKDIFDQWREERESHPWYKRLLDRIKLNWKFEWRYYYRDFKQGIKNLIYWFPIVYEDRNWDHRYIYYILEHKLKAQSKYIGERGNHVTAERDAEVMMVCVRLLDKVGEEFYNSEYSDYHKTKHWFESCEDKEGYLTWKSRELSENFDEYFSKYPLIYKRVLNGEGPFKLDGPEDKQRIAMNIGHINGERANDLLFKIMRDNTTRWWD